MTQELSAATVAFPPAPAAPGPTAAFPAPGAVGPTTAVAAAGPTPARVPGAPVTARPGNVAALVAPPTAPVAGTPKPALVVTAAAKRANRPLPTAAAPPLPQPPEPRPRRGTNVQVFRIVTCELAVVVALPALWKPWPVAVTLGAAAAVLLAVSTIRLKDRPLSSSLAALTGLLLRRTRHDCGSPELDPSALLPLLAPDTAIRTGDVGGSPAGLLSRPGGLVAVLRPRSDGTAFLHEVATGLAGQLVLHAGPTRDRPNRVWFAVRARRDVDVFDDEDLAPVLTNTVRRTLRRLARAGTPAEPLSEKELWTTVVALTHTGSGRGLLREDWRYWRSGSVAQAGFRLVGLDRLRVHDRVQVLERLLAVTPGVAVTAAVVTDEPWGAAAVLRVAGGSGAAVDLAAAELIYVGERLGVRLERLDGRHAHAVAATLPIGGEPQ